MDKLEAMLKYVSEHNDFYKNRIEEYGITNPLDITQWPILTRKELQENRYNMFSDGYKSKYYLQELRHHTSSGSSGIPVDVYWSNDNYNKSILDLWRFRAKYYAITPYDKKVMFSPIGIDGVAYENKKCILPRDNILIFNRNYLKSEKDCNAIIDIIDQYAPDWLYIQPSVLERLIEIYEIRKETPPNSIRYIECFGEQFSTSLKDYARDFFEAEIANMYGSEENNGIAISCPCGDMHVLDKNVYIEILENKHFKKNGRGEAVITNLNNYAMPLIRYAQGDIIHIDRKICTCSNIKSSVISVMEGRTIDVISENNIVISAYLLSDIVNNAQFVYNNPIQRYKFVYHKKSKKLKMFLIYKAEKRAWNNTIFDYIAKKIFEISNGEILLEIEQYSDNDIVEWNQKFRVLTIVEDE